ncbi:zinc ribbon domain-containing protein [Nonomuraea aurantiaca]|uniref:zinc ribbon domain-containing protein n=1 Tax=Nonomuraea aurantiaca TaxID=2878562 RepID=UPI001CD98EE3|nr:zinc ribbon domain-containing protein [Nonomuraea aurantiaca]MCA2220126.1 transposase [Nonomuraea aurantiaca]
MLPGSQGEPKTWPLSLLFRQVAGDNQETFLCTSCGFAEHADVNAARNIAARGVASWAVSHAADDAA